MGSRKPITTPVLIVLIIAACLVVWFVSMEYKNEQCQNRGYSSYSNGACQP